MAITRTSQLADIVKQAHPAWEKHKHPATRTFQAIRMHINNELSELESALEVVLSSLATGGRLVVISFHSLEDRMVKKFMARCAKGDAFPRGVPVTAEQLKPALKLIGRPIRPTADEVQVNSRARSAVMRTAEKLEIEPAVAL